MSDAERAERIAGRARYREFRRGTSSSSEWNATLDEWGIGHDEPLYLVHPDAFAAMVAMREGEGPHNGTRTSRQAAKRNAPRAGTQRWLFLAKLQHAADAGELGLTRQQMEKLTGIDGNTVQPRMNEFVEDGFACEPGTTRKTDSGCDAMVVCITEKGRAALELRLVA